jgi:hypothetical protein
VGFRAAETREKESSRSATQKIGLNNPHKEHLEVCDLTGNPAHRKAAHLQLSVPR